MVQGLKFLSKKGFNPQNLSNQKRVWEVEQDRKLQAQRVQEREQQLKREREDEELARARGDTPKLSFLYAPPPGLEGADKKKSAEDGGTLETRATTAASKTTDLTEIQPGDDPATAAFRRMLARGTDEEEEHAQGSMPQDSSNISQAFKSTVLQGSSAEREAKKATLSALEHAVGRRKEAQAALTLDEQIQRFPVLANAPRAKGMSATDIGVKFNPLGTQIRNVKCLACGIWGHSRGDRECQLSGWDPFASRSSTAAPEPADPKSRNSSSKSDDDRKPRKKEKRKRYYYSDDEDSSISSRRSSRSDDEESFSSASSYDRDRKHKHKRHKKSSRKHESRRHGRDRSRSGSRKKSKSSKRSKQDKERRRDREYGKREGR